MLLQDKVAVVFGAGGSIGGAVARAYADAGAQLHLTSRTPTQIDGLPDRVEALDATDEAAVEAYAERIVAERGRIDIAFNCMGYGDVQKPLAHLATDDFLRPIVTAMRGQYITTRAVGRHMMRQKSGVVLYFGGGGPQTVRGIGGFKIALDAIEGLRRQFAKEFGPSGVRFVTIRTGGVGESLPADYEGREELIEMLKEPSPMHGIADFADVGNVAVFLASDHGRSITDTAVNIGYGAMPD
jgi:NAD(P)-dependent dehydrogenase (short-subunit alcohol dehydrogenase family)